MDSQIFNQDGSPVIEKKPFKTPQEQSLVPLKNQANIELTGGVESAQFAIDPQRVSNPPSGLSLQSATLNAVP